MANKNIQLKDGNGNLLMPKTGADVVTFDKTLSNIGDGDVQSAIDTLCDGTLGRNEDMLEDLQYSRFCKAYKGVRQNAYIKGSDGGTTTPLELNYSSTYCVMIFQINGGEKFQFKRLRQGTGMYSYAFYDTYVSCTGSNYIKLTGTNFISGQRRTSGNNSTDLNFEFTAPANARMMLVQTLQNATYRLYQSGNVVTINQLMINPAVSIADKTGMIIDDWTLMVINTTSLSVGSTMPYWSNSSTIRGKRLSVKQGQVLLVDLTMPDTGHSVIFTDNSRVITEMHSGHTKQSLIVPNDGYAYLMDNQLTTSNYIYNDANGGIAMRIEEVEESRRDDVSTLQSSISSVNTNIRSLITNGIAPFIPYWANPLATTNDNHRQLVREVYVPNASPNVIYTLRCGRNYTQMNLYLDADGTQIASATKGVTNASGTAWYPTAINGLWQLMNGADVIAYVKLKNTEWLKELFLDAPLSTTNKFTTDALRVEQIEDLSCSPYINFLLNSSSSGSSTTPWADKVIAMYGDSVASGNDAVKPYTIIGNDWMVRVADYLGASRVYNRSMPSTSNKDTGNGGKICGVDETGHQTFNGYLQTAYNITWSSYKGDPSQITIPTGTEAVIPSAGCYWERITKMFPTSIKTTINAIFIFFHNDGSSSVEPSWVANSSVDAEWAASGSEYYGKYNGDYNISETTGALYSTIMKMQLWMPQALIILCTPWSGLQNTTNVIANRTAQSDNVRYAAINNSVPLIDVNAICAVNGRNGSLYMKDSSDWVHPNVDGGKLLARAFCSGMLGIVPKF